MSILMYVVPMCQCGSVDVDYVEDVNSEDITEFAGYVCESCGRYDIDGLFVKFEVPASLVSLEASGHSCSSHVSW